LPVKEKALNILLWAIPNTYSDDTPVGKDEDENKVIRSWGTPTIFPFEAKDHADL
jgi:seryl-tRNA synthetase